MAKTAPEPIRDTTSDHLLTPENCAVVIIDFQQTQYDAVGSATNEEIDLGAVTLAKLAHAYKVPTIVSTVGVGMGVNDPTVPQVMNELPGIEEIDRTGVNAWEDADVRAAIEATGRKKLVMAGLWTEVCLTFPTLDLLEAGYEVYPVLDAVGGVSTVAHHAAIERMIQAGAQPVTSLAFGAELMRNWAREGADRFRTPMTEYFAEKKRLKKSSLFVA